jgi:hypothetical protein
MGGVRESRGNGIQIRGKWESDERRKNAGDANAGTVNREPQLKGIKGASRNHMPRLKLD